jgi:hypothetical protein
MDQESILAGKPDLGQQVIRNILCAGGLEVPDGIEDELGFCERRFRLFDPFAERDGDFFTARLLPQNDPAFSLRPALFGGFLSAVNPS